MAPNSRNRLLDHYINFEHDRILAKYRACILRR